MRYQRVYCTALVITTVALLARLFPQFFFLTLAQPAAYISALWLGVPCAATGDSFLLMDPALPVAVTQHCSGADFLALLCGLIAPLVCFPLRRRYVLPAFMSAVAITIAANSCRIISGWYSGLWARRALSQSYWPGIHMATGIVVFLTVLIATHIVLSILERKQYA